MLNAGVGIYVYGLAGSIKEGCRVARKVLESGRAVETLEKWVATSHKV